MIRNVLNRALAPVLRTMGISQWVFDLLHPNPIDEDDLEYGPQLTHVIKNEGADQCSMPLFCCLRNEMHRIPFFLKYYRNMGVDHFFFIDNGSSDGFIEFAEKQPDCSVWYTENSYKASNFGMKWCNYLLHKYGIGKWCLTVDPDEFFVYPKMEVRNLKELTQFMDGIEQNSLFSVMIDTYSDKKLEDAILTKDDSPFDICPFFDRYNYTQRMNWETGSCWVQGGVRMRTFFKENPQGAPAQNKVPLIKWQKSYRYLSSMHHTNTPAINCSIEKDDRYVSGVLFHFKYVGSLQQKIEEEMVRKEHYNAGNEYKAYRDGVSQVLYDPHWSVKYQDSEQLLQLRLMHRGEWF